MSKTATPKKRKMTMEEYADWLHTPEGQAAERRSLEARRGRPTLTVETALTPNEMAEVAKKTGANLFLKKGTGEHPNDRAVIEEILARAAAKTTQAVSLRLSLADIEAAKRLAAKTGLGYQVILKDIIHEGLAGA